MKLNQPILLLVIGCIPLALANLVEVHLQNGPIIGKRILTSGEPHPITRFLGIPFAEPPIGELRFRRPRPFAHKWTEPFQALAWPTNCIQFDKVSFVYAHPESLHNSNQSEDCLYLNVWSPDVGVSYEKELKPVIVWIHGGALFMGTSSFDLFDGEMLAAKTDSVVVSFNYRLSTLGFLYSDDDPEVKGNQGLWDQVLALEWIQENIRYFGGNPNQVTIMGESAGAWSVSVHILSSASRNLFQSAIHMSGAAINEKTVATPQAFTTNFLTGIRKVGCAKEEDLKISKQVVECLRKLDASQVDMILFMIDKDPTDLQPLIVIDGDLLPDKPLNLLTTGNFKHNLNLLVSTVEDEGSFLLALTSPQFRAQNPDPLSLAQAKEFLVDYVENHYLHQKVDQKVIEKLYYSGLNPHLDSENEFRKRTGIAYGDLMLGCPTLAFAKQLYWNSPTSTVYQWHYKAKMGGDKLLSHQWAGTSHCDDLYPAFGLPLRHPQDYFARERDIANEVMNFIGHFVRTGKPGPFQSEWEPYFQSNDGNVLAPYYEINNGNKKAENFRFNLKQLECGLIWNQFNEKWS